MCAGKEGYPTIAFNVHCSHNKRVVYVAPAQPGNRNDKTIVKYDAFIDKLRTEDLYKTFKFKLWNEKGELVTHHGCYVVCDGGYHQWRVSINGFKHGTTYAERALSKRMESIRKDIECVFGRLKRRFAILRLPMQYKKKSRVAMTFKVRVP